MELKPAKIKSEPADEHAMDVDMKEEANVGQSGAVDEEVVQEFSVVLLRPSADQTIGRLLFERMQPRKMDSCNSRTKQQVKHLELTYKTAQNHEGEPVNQLAALYDGIYNGENLNKNETLLRDAVGFFESGRFYILPISEAYEMHRKICKPKKKEDEETVDQNKIDDANLAAELDLSPDPLDAVRVSYARVESDWQKKRREQSAQYKQQIIDSDPWLDLQVKKTNVRQVYKERVERAEDCKPAIVNLTHKLPVL